jgi:hypothetical protein
LAESAVAIVSRAVQNSWVGNREIISGATHDGQRISPTASRVLSRLEAGFFAQGE